MKTIGFYVSPGFQMLDLAGPAGAFEAANRELGRPAYRIAVVAAEAGAVTNSLGMTIAAASIDEAVPDTLMVVGGRLDPPLPADTLGRLAETASRTRRVASICVGAFTLAAAGLLDGLRATTHWIAAAELARRYPAVQVDPDVLFVDNGQVLTSAGAAAGLDLCLHLIRRDYGALVAADAARLAVMPLERAGGQAQFIVHAEPSPEG